jgi:RNA polymerase sigma-70 factor (ECF subfamily)
VAKRSTGLTRTEEELLDSVRGGDGEAFRRLVDPHRADLYAHCYRMPGSLRDADDALQETLLRAWRALWRFGGLGLLRPWLYKIATDVCLDALARRPRRLLPVDQGSPSGPDDGEMRLQDGNAAREARYERREAVELAFITRYNISRRASGRC